MFKFFELNPININGDTHLTCSKIHEYEQDISQVLVVYSLDAEL